MLKNKKILISGGAGFIGSKLIRALIHSNHITVLDNLRRNALTRTSLMSHQNLHFVKGDVRDSDLVDRLVQGKTHIIHLASLAGVNTVMHNPVLTMDVTIRGTFSMLEAAARQTALERFVYVSTSEVFGSHAAGVREQDATPVGPAGDLRWTYAASKLAAEHLIHAMYQDRSVPGVVIRPFNIFGPGQVGEGAVHHFVRRALSNAPLTVSGNGHQIRAWCYVDDFIDGMLRTLSCPDAVGRTFNIGNPQTAVTVDYLASLIIKLADSASEIRYAPETGPDVALRIPDIGAANSLLGFIPKVGLEQGLTQTIAWYRRHPETDDGTVINRLSETDPVLNLEGANNYGPH